MPELPQDHRLPPRLSDRTARCGCPGGLPCYERQARKRFCRSQILHLFAVFPGDQFPLGPCERGIHRSGCARLGAARPICRRGLRRDHRHPCTGVGKKTVDIGERIGFQHKNRHHAVRAGRWSPWDSGFAVTMCGAESPLKKRGNRVLSADPVVARDGQ